MTTSRFTTPVGTTGSTSGNNEALKLLAWVGLPALGLASLGGIGIVGGGLAIGLAAEELLGIGAVAGLIARNSARKRLPAALSPVTDIPTPEPMSAEIDSLRRGDF